MVNNLQINYADESTSVYVLFLMRELLSLNFNGDNIKFTMITDKAEHYAVV